MIKTCLPKTRSGIEQVCRSPDGRWFALRYQDKTLLLLDTTNDYQINKPAVTGQRSISAASFDDQNRLWVVDQMNRATAYSLPALQMEQVFSPHGNWVDRVDRYLIRPLYFVFPKPSEFYKVVMHLSKTRDASDDHNVDLTKTIQPPDPMLPLWSGLAFMVFMLCVSCTVFHFKDY